MNTTTARTTNASNEHRRDPENIATPPVRQRDATASVEPSQSTMFLSLSLASIRLAAIKRRENNCNAEDRIAIAAAGSDG
jgi:hypothetical protein